MVGDLNKTDAKGRLLTLASPKLLGLIQDIEKQVGTANTSLRLRYSVGVSPTMSLNVRLKVPRLPNPTSRQMSVTLRGVSLQQEHRALHAPALKIAMRRLAEGRPEGPDEMSLGHGRDLGEARDVKRLSISPVDRIASAQHAAIELLHGPSHPTMLREGGGSPVAASPLRR